MSRRQCSSHGIPRCGADAQATHGLISSQGVLKRRCRQQHPIGGSGRRHRRSAPPCGIARQNIPHAGTRRSGVGHTQLPAATIRRGNHTAGSLEQNDTTAGTRCLGRRRQGRQVDQRREQAGEFASVRGDPGGTATPRQPPSSRARRAARRQAPHLQARPVKLSRQQFWVLVLLTLVWGINWPAMKLGISGTRMSRMLEGMWVNTIVLISPTLAAIRAAASADSAANRFAPKKIAPINAGSTPQRTWNQ